MRGHRRRVLDVWEILGATAVLCGRGCLAVEISSVMACPLPLGGPLESVGLLACLLTALVALGCLPAKARQTIGAVFYCGLIVLLVKCRILPSICRT